MIFPFEEGKYPSADNGHLDALISEYECKIRKYSKFRSTSHVAVIYENVVEDLKQLRGGIL